jgi:hypothetical protein
MKKLLVLVLLTAMSMSAQSITKEATVKMAEKDHKALVTYAAELLRKIDKYERKIAELRKTLAQVESGELKAHQIPKNCAGCISLGNSNSALVFVDN